LIAHEAKHLEQGFDVALSVYGELEAWQVQNKVLIGLGESLTDRQGDLDGVQLNFDIDNLLKAENLMGKYNPGYAWRIKLAPLRPWGYYLPKEIYGLTP
jgi:hypothetical protein